MDLTPRISINSQVIQGYSVDNIRVSGVVYKSGILVLQDKVIELPSSNFLELSQADIDSIKAEDIGVLLVGTGETQHFLEPGQKEQLSKAGINAETMTTGSACRTYNVLMAEGRRVGTLLY